MDIVYDMRKKGIVIPQRKTYLSVQLLSSFGTIIISQFQRFVNIFSEIYSVTFREVEKSLPCVKGGGTRQRDGGIVKG